MARICASQNRDIVSALILKSFSARSVAEQRLIYEQSRPFPKLGLQCGGRKFCFEWYERKLGFVAVQVSRIFSVGHAYFFGLDSLLHGLAQAIRISMVSSLIVKSTRLLSRARERKKRGKPSIYLSLRRFSRARREEIEHHNEEVIQTVCI